MIGKMFFLTCVLFLMTSAAMAINLNSTSTLDDQGISPAAGPATVLDNIPLFDGLQLATDKELLKVFPESASNHPLVTVGIVDVDDVYNFYKRTLPQQGWKATSSRDYVKNAIALHIDAHADGKISTVTFSEVALTP